jgi:hypothetical protein
VNATVDLDSLLAQALQDLKAGTRSAEVTARLEQHGVPHMQAAAIVRQLRAEAFSSSPGPSGSAARAAGGDNSAAIGLGVLLLLAGIAVVLFGLYGMSATADSASSAGSRGAGKILGAGVVLVVSGGSAIVKALM